MRGVATPLPPQGQKRTAAMRSEAMSNLHESYSVKETIKEHFRFTVGHFSAYKQFWEGFTHEQAEGAFYEALAEQSEHENSDGEPTVLVKGHVRERHITGVRTGTQTTTRGTVGTGSSSSGLHALVKAGNRGPPSLAGPSEYGDEASKRTHDACDDDADGPDDDAGSTAQPSLGKPLGKSPAAKVRRLTMDALKVHMASGSTGAAQGDVAQNVNMLRSRSELQKEAKESYDEATGSKSPYTLLLKKIKSTPAESIRLMETDPQAVADGIKRDLIEPLRILCETSAKLPLKDVAASKVKSWSMLWALTIARSFAEICLDPRLMCIRSFGYVDLC